jgi:hypothetical protein
MSLSLVQGKSITKKLIAWEFPYLLLVYWLRSCTAVYGKQKVRNDIIPQISRLVNKFHLISTKAFDLAMMAQRFFPVILHWST